MKQFKSLMKSFLGVMAVLAVVSCESDTWKDHYSFRSDSNDPTGSLAQTLNDMPEAAKFVQALRTTYMFNGNKQLRITYWQFLNDNQFLTVWLPDAESISDADWDRYTSTAKDKDHKLVGTEFILNHIARFSHPVGTETKEKVKMMSNKTYRSVGDGIDGVSYKETNIRCSNGVLHKLNGKIVYRPNLYEYITGALTTKSDKGQDYDFRTIGSWIDLYTNRILDEENSIEGDYNANTGLLEYVDSVIKTENPILKKYAFIDSEDSSYSMVLPLPSVWQTAYDRIKDYFTYESGVIGGDSLQRYWTNSSMITDLFFNNNIQTSINDSATSTLFKWSERRTQKYPYHVFYKPFSEGGLFADATVGNGVVDKVTCSNGTLYIRNDWPYSDSIFRRTIRIEAEDILVDNEEKKISSRPKTARYTLDSVNYISARVMEISAETKSWSVDYDIKNNLKGKYDVKFIFFRNSEKKQNTVYFNIDYLTDSDGIKKLYVAQKGPKKTTYKVGTRELPDTIGIGTIEFPTGNYESGSARLTVQVGCQGSSNTTTESNKVWLDCIILEPVFE